ncbi:MAG TPA: tetratricopeptide repeat protein [Vicinamibacterales bacterium]
MDVRIDARRSAVAGMLGFVACVFIVLIAAYAPALHGTMLWDDDGHLTRAGLRSWAGLARIWFEPGATQQYYPLVHSAFWLQALLWHDTFLGYHLVNVILHGVSASLLVVFLRRLEIRGALVAGAIFALHPVQAESVAWMTELKNTLSGVFYMAAALAYLRYDRQRDPRSYLVSLTLFFCALASKTVTATLPAALLAVFWWRRGSLDWRRDVRPLVPFLALGALAGVTTAWVERTFIGARGADFTLTPIERLLVAGRAVLFYAGKDLWPVNLTFIYPRWNVSQDVWWQYLFPAAVVVMLLAGWAVRRRSRAPLAAAVVFCATLGPALGFVNVYPFRYSFVADHFQYLACAAVFVPVAAMLTSLALRAGLTAMVAERVLCVVIIVPLALATHAEARKYADGVTLYAVTLQQNPGCWLCLENLGVAAQREVPPQRERAIESFRAALRINPTDAQLHNNLGTTLMELGRLDEAVAEQRQAIRFAPGYAEAYGNLGVALHKLGRQDEAAAAYRTALEIKPGLTFARTNLTILLAQTGHGEEARTQLQGAGGGQATDPGAPAGATAVQLGDASTAVGEYAAAAAHYRDALTQGGDTPATRMKLGIALARNGAFADAAAQLRLVVQAAPRDASGHANLANVMMSLQDFEHAIVEFQAALALDPRVATVRNDFGVALARTGRRNEAIQQFQEALRLDPDYAAARANLARATRK